MTTAQIIFAAIVLILLVYALGKVSGRHEQRKLWEDHMDLGNRYRWAVDDLDRWCGHVSPEARLIAAHLEAVGEGCGLNAGTPIGAEPCTIDGLRTQLERMKGRLKAGDEDEAKTVVFCTTEVLRKIKDAL